MVSLWSRVGIDQLRRCVGWFYAGLGRTRRLAEAEGIVMMMVTTMNRIIPVLLSPCPSRSCHKFYGYSREKLPIWSS